MDPQGAVTVGHFVMVSISQTCQSCKEFRTCSLEQRFSICGTRTPWGTPAVAKAQGVCRKKYCSKIFLSKTENTNTFLLLAMLLFEPIYIFSQENVKYFLAIRHSMLFTK